MPVHAVKSVLVVDDTSAEHVAKGLEEEGFFAMPYKSGLQAIDDINGGLRYHVAFVGLSFPDTDGYTVMAASKRVNPHTPVVQFSAYHFSRGRKPLCCDDQIPKGRIEEMVRAIRRHCE